MGIITVTLSAADQAGRVISENAQQNAASFVGPGFFLRAADDSIGGAVGRSRQREDFLMKR